MAIKQLLATLALSTLTCAMAQADQLSDVMSKKSLDCGVYADVPPFSAPDPVSRELVGMDVDLCKALAKTLGVELQLKPMSVEARIAEVKMGRVDVIFANLAYTKTRADQIQFSDPYYIAKETLVVRAVNADQPKSFFKDKRISSTKGSTSEQSIRIAGANPVTFQDTGSAYMALQQNKVVGLVTNTMTAIKLVNQAGRVVCNWRWPRSRWPWSRLARACAWASRRFCTRSTKRWRAWKRRVKSMRSGIAGLARIPLTRWCVKTRCSRWRI